MRKDDYLSNDTLYKSRHQQQRIIYDILLLLSDVVAMKKFLFIRWDISQWMFHGATKGKLLYTYIQKTYPHIECLFVSKDHYNGICANQLVFKNIIIDAWDIVWCYFLSSSWYPDIMPQLLVWILQQGVSCNINHYSVLFRDKSYQASFYAQYRLPHPVTYRARSLHSTYKYIQKMSFSEISHVVVKHPVSSGGKGVFLLETKNHRLLLSKLKTVRNKMITLDTLLPMIKPLALIVQQYIEGVEGIDYRCNIVMGSIVTIFRRCNPDDFKSNCATGGEADIINQQDLSEDIIKQIEYCVSVVYQKTKMPFFNLDFMISWDSFYICEANPVWSYFIKQYGNNHIYNQSVVRAIAKDIYVLK